MISVLGPLMIHIERCFIDGELLNGKCSMLLNYVSPRLVHYNPEVGNHCNKCHRRGRVRASAH